MNLGLGSDPFPLAKAHEIGSVLRFRVFNVGREELQNYSGRSVV